MNAFQTKCVTCGGATSRKYAREHQGRCKPCVAPASASHAQSTSREARILESGYQAYAREEGHYDQGDY